MITMGREQDLENENNGIYGLTKNTTLYLVSYLKHYWFEKWSEEKFFKKEEVLLTQKQLANAILKGEIWLI